MGFEIVHMWQSLGKCLFMILKEIYYQNREKHSYLNHRNTSLFVPSHILYSEKTDRVSCKKLIAM